MNPRLRKNRNPRSLKGANLEEIVLLRYNPAARMSGWWGDFSTVCSVSLHTRLFKFVPSGDMQMVITRNEMKTQNDFLIKSLYTMMCEYSYIAKHFTIILSTPSPYTIDQMKRGYIYIEIKISKKMGVLPVTYPICDSRE